MMMRTLISAGAVLALASAPAAAQNQAAGWAAVDSAVGRAGMAQDGGVWGYRFPRRDLTVTVGDVTVMPGLALRSWVAFRRTGVGAEAMLMGDLVLLESEVSPVISKLEELGVHATALHNHLQGESPRVMYLHISGRGDPVRLGRAIHAALALTATPDAVPDGRGLAIRFQLDTTELAAALGRKGKVSDGAWGAAAPRAESIRVGGMVVPPAMGLATSIGVQPLGEGKAAVAGDFVLVPSEVTPVVRALRAAGITVTAIHSHMVDEQPRLIFVHYWATGDALTLTRALRDVLARTHVAPAARR
jgi:hypothetical protein